jgi:hypothetical protein
MTGDLSIRLMILGGPPLRGQIRWSACASPNAGPDQSQNYSQRTATMGSRREARRAGM